MALGVSKSCAHSTVKKFTKNRHCTPKVRSGRPSKLTDRDKRLIIRIALADRFRSVTDIRSIFLSNREDFDISNETIRLHLKKAGLLSYKVAKKPLLTKAMKRKRLQWCREMKDKDLEF